MLTARNPPPVCVPFPYIPILNFCIRFFDITAPNATAIHACIDFETRLSLAPILVMHFDCVRLNSSGIQWIKPEDRPIADVQNLTLPVGPPLPMSSNYDSLVIKPSVPLQTTTQQPAADIFDPVEFESDTANKTAGNSIIDVIHDSADKPSLTPEEEDAIGQLKY